MTVSLFNDTADDYTNEIEGTGYNVQLLRKVQQDKQSHHLLLDKLVSFYEQPDPHLK